MANAPVLPRVVRNVVEEHRALRALLAEVERAFARPSPHAASGPDVVAARLDTLRGPLGAHFEEEERARAVRGDRGARPRPGARLLPPPRRARGAHPPARRAARVEPRSPGAGPTWTHDVRAFLDDLSGHEERETDLLTRTLDGSIGALD